jgi:hypothetical protein
MLYQHIHIPLNQTWHNVHFVNGHSLHTKVSKLSCVCALIAMFYRSGSTTMHSHCWCTCVSVPPRPTHHHDTPPTLRHPTATFLTPAPSVLPPNDYYCMPISLTQQRWQACNTIPAPCPTPSHPHDHIPQWPPLLNHHNHHTPSLTYRPPWPQPPCWYGTYSVYQQNLHIDTIYRWNRPRFCSFNVFLVTIQIFGAQQLEFWCEESRLWRKTITTSKTNINQYKPSRPSPYISNYFIITLLIALLIALCIALHIDFLLLGIISDLLHFYILVLLIAFSYAMHLGKH